MKIAIHDRPGSFSEHWIEYCQQKNIPYKLVNCYRSDIILQLADCAALMWHHHHADYKDVLLAKHLLFSIEQSGKRVFPDFNTCWHFDDKLGQKYLLESIAAPLVQSYVFYTKEEAINWANSALYPKVFKLSSGAGSANVKLVRKRGEAIRLIKKAFGKGFPQFDRWGYLKEQIRKIKIGKERFMIGMLKGFGRLVLSTAYSRIKGKEKGYVYFQDFVPNNNSDTRVIVIGDRAFAIKRMIRENDFRASGSGLIIHNKEAIDTHCIGIAFEISDKLKLQCMAYDFVFDRENKPQIIEISYGFSPEGYIACPGYWDNKLNYYAGKFNPYGWMVDICVFKKDIDK